MINRSSGRCVTAGAIVGVLAYAISLQAQGIEEIIITTQKREQKLADVPLSVSAFDGKLLEEANVKDFRDLVALAPGLHGGTDDGFTDALNIRGISTNDFGIGGDPSVPVFVDGVWEGRNGGAVTSFLDIDRTEVVRGPQNTLFGRNAIAGAISIVTNKPKTDFLAGSFDAAVENYGHYELTGMVNAPISDKLAFRGSAVRLEENGYLTNLAGGDKLGAHTRTAGQAALRFKGDALDITFTTFYEARRSDPSVYWSTFPLAADGSLDPNGTPLPRNKVSSDLNAAGNGRDNSRILKFTLNAEAELSDGNSLTSITGFKTYKFFYREDYDATNQPTNNYQQDQDVNYVSQELRLNSAPNQKLVWFAGASIYSENVHATFDNIYSENAFCRALVKTEVGNDPLALNWPEGTTVSGCADQTFQDVWGAIDTAAITDGKSERNISRGHYLGFGLYADGTWAITDRLDLTVGARYTFDRKEFRTSVIPAGGALGNNFVWPYFTDGFVSKSASWTHFNPRLALNFRMTDQWAFYGNVGTGYKSGGFSTFGLDLPAGTAPDSDGLVPPGTVPKKFNPEKVLSFEAGTRARLFDDTLQANLSVYHYLYDDLQLTFFQNGAQITGNVARANGTGVELDGRWKPTQDWDVLVSMAWSHTRIDRVDQAFLDAGGCDNCAGKELWFNPAWTSTEIVTRHFPLAAGSEIFLSAEHHYQDSMFAGPDNLALSVTPGYSVYHLRLGYDSGGRWTATAYVQNLTNRQYFERGWENADADNHFGYGLVNSLVWPSKPRTVGLKFGYKFGGS
jgi:iron complex outermembrane receptor protein